jgi:hypothetical protein
LQLARNSDVHRLNYFPSDGRASRSPSASIARRSFTVQVCVRPRRGSLSSMRTVCHSLNARRSSLCRGSPRSDRAWPPPPSKPRLTPRSGACTIRVTHQINYPPGDGHSFGPPKSRAGRRGVSFPDLMAPDLRQHLDGLVTAALVFTSPDGKPLRHSNFYRRVWMPALIITGLPGTHFHDLRHAGNQFTADARANPCELMERMGPGSARAAPGLRSSNCAHPPNGSVLWQSRSARTPKRHLASLKANPSVLARGRHARRGRPREPSRNLRFAWSDLARPAGFEPATRCLEGTLKAS